MRFRSIELALLGLRDRDLLRESYQFGTAVRNNRIEGGGIVVLSGSQNAVNNNLVSNAPFEGMFIINNGAPPALEVTANAVISSGGAGIRIVASQGSQITVGRNIVLDNSGLGIDAPGVIDGGDNLAGGNGNPLRCLGVSCSTQLSSELGMCLVDRAQCEDALSSCNSVVIPTNGDLNGDTTGPISSTSRSSDAGSRVILSRRKAEPESASEPHARANKTRDGVANRCVNIDIANPEGRRLGERPPAAQGRRPLERDLLPVDRVRGAQVRHDGRLRDEGRLRASRPLRLGRSPV